MKLLRLYIENFGKLQHYKIDFSSGLTVLQERNGFGKTTLAVFIKVMFYGFPKSGKSLEKNERKKYTPWQGGIYGGYIEFEIGENAYRLERTFGSSSKSDRFRLFNLNSNSLSNDFTENIGYELFGLNAESFEKTIYMTQNHRSTGELNAELKAVLSNTIENTTDMGTYSKALQTLRAQRNKLYSYRGKDGLIYQVNSEISSLDLQLEEAKQAEHNMIDLQNALLRAKAEHKHTAEQISKLEANANLQNKNNERTELQSEFEALNEKYPTGIPTQNELNQLSNYLFQVEQPDTWNLPKSYQTELQSLSAFFSDGFPNNASMKKYQEMIDRNNDLSRKISHLNSELNSINFSYSWIFLSIIPALVVSLLSLSNSIKINFTHWEIFTHLGIFISGTLLFIFFLIHLRKMRKIRLLQSTISGYNRQLEEINASLSVINDKYDLNHYSVPEAFSILKENRERYIQLRNIKKEAVTHGQNLKNKVIRDAQTILGKYPIFTQPLTQELINQIAVDSFRMIQLEKRIGYFHTHDQPSKDVTLQKFGSGKEIYSLHFDDLSKLHEHKKHLENEILNYHRTIAILELKSQQQTTLQSKLTACTQKKTQYLKQIDLIDKAILHLQRAHKQLTVGFIYPLKDRFAFYLSKLMDISTDKLFLNADAEISLEISGIQREQAYFSSGEIDLMNLCLRIAIIDILYQNIKPPLILDDPFVNLDYDHIAAALKILSDISETHQILYMTCHKSRT